MADVPLIILSHKRAGRVTTHKYFAYCTICVPQSQSALYNEAHPELDQLVHPDQVVGNPAKRQWILDRYGDVFMLDDDCVGMYRLYRKARARRRAIVSPHRAYEIIQQTAENAKQFGAFLYGFSSHAHPLSYSGNRPFKFGGYITGGAMGFRSGSRNWFPTHSTLPFADYWICLLNAFYHRYHFQDLRFGCGFKQTYTGAGGIQEFRGQHLEKEVESMEWLRKHFGDAIVGGQKRGNSITKTVRNPGRRLIKLPYRT